MNLILASQSPRRKDLLEQFGVKFSVSVLPTIEEVVGEPISVAKNNAGRKALPVSHQNPGALVFGADTIVTIGREILGKPRDNTEAKHMLQMLSNGNHDVTTVVAFAQDGNILKVFSETTMVYFRDLSEWEIESYVQTGEPLDKAGAYGIQGIGGLLVKSIKGCYYNVVGLPMSRLALELRSFGIEVFPSI